MTATPPDPRGVAGLVEAKALRDLMRGYVSLMENGRDRILFLGGDCDALDVMEAGDPYLKAAKAALAASPVSQRQGDPCIGCGADPGERCTCQDHLPVSQPTVGGEARFYRNALASLLRGICSTTHFPQDWSEMAYVQSAEAALRDGPALSTPPASVEPVSQDAEDAARWRWLRENVTFMNVDADFPVDGPNIPVLAQVGERIWYHATDNITATTLDELAAAARQEKGR